MTTTTPPLLGTLESALYADDLDAAEVFWTGIMGLELIEHLRGRNVFFRVPGGQVPQVLLVFDPSVTIVPAPRERPIRVPHHGANGPGHFCLAVADEDLNAWRSYLEDRGIQIEADFRWQTGRRSIYFRDPAGNSIELADPRIWDR